MGQPVPNESFIKVMNSVGVFAGDVVLPMAEGGTAQTSEPLRAGSLVFPPIMSQAEMGGASEEQVGMLGLWDSGKLDLSYFFGGAAPDPEDPWNKYLAERLARIEQLRRNQDLENYALNFRDEVNAAKETKLKAELEKMKATVDDADSTIAESQGKLNDMIRAKYDKNWKEWGVEQGEQEETIARAQRNLEEYRTSVRKAEEAVARANEGTTKALEDYSRYERTLKNSDYTDALVQYANRSGEVQRELEFAQSCHSQVQRNLMSSPLDKKIAAERLHKAQNDAIKLLEDWSEFHGWEIRIRTGFLKSPTTKPTELPYVEYPVPRKVYLDAMDSYLTALQNEIDATKTLILAKSNLIRNIELNAARY